MPSVPPTAECGREPLAPVLLDLGILTALLALAAVPLVVLRGSTQAPSAVFGGVAAAGGALCVAWAALRRHLSSSDQGDPVEALASTRERWREAARCVAVVALLGVVTVVGFYLPLRKHFWGGVDEGMSLHPAYLTVWSATWDTMGRPLEGLAGWLATTLTPGRIEGFLWLAAALCLLKGLLLWGILRRLAPGAGTVSAAAAVLLICHRGDALRFFVLWGANYYCLCVCLLMLAFWLLLVSYQRRSSWLLVAACLVLGASLLSSEAGLLLALLGPVCLRLLRRDGRDFLVWSYGWLGTTLLIATRFVLYLCSRGAGSYQAGQASALLKSPGLLLHHLRAVLEPLLSFLRLCRPSGHLAVYALVAAAATALLLWLSRRGAREPVARRPYWLGAALAATAAALGLAPFVHIGTAVRTQFFAAPAEAALLALLLDRACACFGPRFRSYLLTAAGAGLVAVAVADSHRAQELARGPIYFEKTVHVFQQVHAVCPQSPKALVLFVLDRGAASPLGLNYHVAYVAEAILGVRASQANYADPYGMTPSFTDDGVVVPFDVGHADVRTYPFDRVVAFRLAGDGTVSLLSRLPDSLVSSPAAARYNPLAVLHAAPLSELPYLRYTSWMRPPLDVLAPADGLVFGAGWGPLQFSGGRLSRLAEQGAEVVVNPSGATTRDIALEVEPPDEAGPYTLQMLDGTGRVAWETVLDRHQTIQATLGVDPDRVALYRLRLERAGQPCPGFRVFAPGGPWREDPNRRRPRF